MSDSNMINLLEDKHPVRVYKFVQHLDGTDWTLDALEKGFSHRTIKGWAWILQDQDVGTDHVHVLLWTHKEISPEILASWFALPGPQVQDLLAGQEPLAPQTHQRSQLGLVMGRPQVLHDPAHTMVLGHDLHGRGPRGCLDLTQVRTHPPDPTAALVPRNDHPTPTNPTKNPTPKHKPPQPVQLRMEASTAHSPLLLLAHLEDRGLPADAADHGHHAVVIRRVRLPSGGAEAAAPS